MEGRGGILVIDDGDVGGLIGCAAAGEEAAAGAKACVWADVGRSDGVLREQAVRRHAELYGLDVVGGLESLTGAVESGPVAATHLLTAAGTAAMKAGLQRVLWCVHHGAGDERERPDLDAIAKACDRALLASRLLSLDVDGEIRIDAAYADFSDVQMIELAADMDAPLESCWWAQGASPPALGARTRWTQAMEAAGLGDLLVS